MKTVASSVFGIEFWTGITYCTCKDTIATLVPPNNFYYRPMPGAVKHIKISFKHFKYRAELVKVTKPF